MKVSELIELLQDQDPDAEVMIMSQENWPFENAVAGVAVREQDVQRKQPRQQQTGQHAGD